MTGTDTKQRASWQGSLQVQFAGRALELVTPLLVATTVRGTIPEALRSAHLIAGGITTGKSRGRAWGRLIVEIDRDRCYPEPR